MVPAVETWSLVTRNAQLHLLSDLKWEIRRMVFIYFDITI